jgi:hypothetical protein
MKLKIVIAILVAVVTLGASSRVATGQQAFVTKVSQLLSADGYSYTQPPSHPDVWRVDRTARTLKDVRVVLAASSDGDLLVIFVIVAKKQDMQLTPEFMATLLRLNHTLDHVKVGIDGDGDLFVRTDVTNRMLDAQELKNQIEQVAASANEVYEAAQPNLSH